jgi:putative effector of murein hydrolase LrgA (UPF0299 family)
MRPESDFWVNLMPLMLMSVSVAITAYKLAREKERNVIVWTVLGASPIVNFVCFGYFVGAANLRLERKIDELSKRLGGTS